MGQKIHPLGFRVGITKKHSSHWFAKSNQYAQLLVEDHFLRAVLFEKYSEAGIVDIEIQRKLNEIKIEMKVARPVVLIGRDKKNLNYVRESLEKQLNVYRLNNFNVLNVSNFAKFSLQSKLACSKKISNFQSNEAKFVFKNSKTNKYGNLSDQNSRNFSIPLNSPKISIHVIKISNPYTTASFIADSLIEKLEQRKPFRAALKQAIRSCKRSKIQGLKIQIAGRLNGAEIARTEWIREGRVPLQTLRANIDYSYKTASTIYGLLGIKVWVFNGEVNL